MPKKSAKQYANFPDRLEAFFPEGTRAKVVAIAYHMGARGEYSTPVRNFVVRGIRDYIAGLKGNDLKDFEEILQNVQIQMGAQLGADTLTGLKQKSPA